MKAEKLITYISNILQNMPSDWLKLTTHRLDIYDEDNAKTEFLEEIERLYRQNIYDTSALKQLPTAYDYIRLGHPLSCILEWAIGKSLKLNPENVICFSSRSVPILAILRKNHLAQKKTSILYENNMPSYFDAQTIKSVYGYDFEMKKISQADSIDKFDGSTIYVSSEKSVEIMSSIPNIDFYLNLHSHLGSILIVKNEMDANYIAEIQHVRRRETIAMTPINCFRALQEFIGESFTIIEYENLVTNKAEVQTIIKEITGSKTKSLVASSGLSMQFAIMMGLIDYALENHKGKAIKFIVPPNCYGGTNDQARRVAACLNHVEVVDLLVDGTNDMVKSLATVLTEIAHEDAVPYIIAEIPTNPRVEVPDLIALEEILVKQRKTSSGHDAIQPVFILDQTFCPNVHFLGEGQMLSTVETISYVSGSKFPSGGKCTAGYCVGTTQTANLIDKIERHLNLCDNEATPLQYEILAEQMPSMNERISQAYYNTRDFVNYIRQELPEAKINFVSEDLADQSFTPSVFSLDLPTKGTTDEEREIYKRALNLKLIDLMISEIPNESKFCVSYGQLKGSYWTIPATSTQGTTKEGDKDYIVRVSLAPQLDLDRHKQVFMDFVNSI